MLITEQSEIMIKDILKRYISKNGHNHILIHSDILFGLRVEFKNHENFLGNHYKELKAVCQPLKIIMPSFNYDFCKGSTYNLKDSESQVGALSEYFRKK